MAMPGEDVDVGNRNEGETSGDMVAVVAMCGPGARPHHLSLALPRVAAADRIGVGELRGVWIIPTARMTGTG